MSISCREVIEAKENVDELRGRFYLGHGGDIFFKAVNIVYLRMWKETDYYKWARRRTGNEANK